MYETRLRRLLIAFVGLFALLGARAFHLQVADPEPFVEKMDSTRDIQVRARRGSIHWADGSTMAGNVPGYGLEVVWKELDERLLPTVDEFRASIAERTRRENAADERAVAREPHPERRERVRAERARRAAELAVERSQLVVALGELRDEFVGEKIQTRWSCTVCTTQRSFPGYPDKACVECRVGVTFDEVPPLDLMDLATLLDTDLYGVHLSFVLALGRRHKNPGWRSHAFRVQIPEFAAETIGVDPVHFAGFEKLARSARDVDPLARQIVGGTRLPDDRDFVRLEDPERVLDGLHVHSKAEIYSLLIGSSLLERELDEVLRGAPGHRRETRDAEHDYEWTSHVVRPVLDGEDLHTTLRRDVQRAALEVVDSAPPDGHAAAVVLDVRTGAVVGLASTQRDGMNHARCPLIPGSVYKLVTAVAGLEAGFAPEGTHVCRRVENVRGGVRYRCHAADGEIALVEAFQESCNGFFAQQAIAAGTEAMVSAATRLGFAERYLMDELGGLQSRASGLLHSAPPERGWFAQDLSFIGIGQGYASASPLQVATAYARVASGGKLLRPWVLERNRPAPGEIELDPVLERWSPVLREGARRVVTEGTAAKIELLQAIGAAGKTGTAEVDRRDATGNVVRTNNTWFVGYAPHDDPQFCAVVVFEGMEEGQFGGSVSGPHVARLLAEALLEQ